VVQERGGNHESSVKRPTSDLKFGGARTHSTASEPVKHSATKTGGGRRGDYRESKIKEVTCADDPKKKVYAEGVPQTSSVEKGARRHF